MGRIKCFLVLKARLLLFRASSILSLTKRLKQITFWQLADHSNFSFALLLFLHTSLLLSHPLPGSKVGPVGPKPNGSRRTPLLRLSTVSTFRRLDKLGRFEVPGRKVVQSRLRKVEALGFGCESRIFFQRERMQGCPGGLPPGQDIETLTPDTQVRLVQVLFKSRLGQVKEVTLYHGFSRSPQLFVFFRSFNRKSSNWRRPSLLPKMKSRPLLLCK